jgi:Fe-Mn family superoxide dismutase
MTEYTLPDLDYDYGALEPHISGQINEIHHSKHHATYVKGLNDAIAKLEEARASGDHGAIFLNEKNLAFHLGGHGNHSIWWKNLSPNGGDKPTGDLAAAIDDQFGSFDAFQAHFTAAATTIQGSGWAILGWDQLGGRLLVHQLYDQQANVPLGIIPLLQVDMWEHAYYLQYKNVKADYVKAFWNVVNWEDVQIRFARATANIEAINAGFRPHVDES